MVDRGLESFADRFGPVAHGIAKKRPDCDPANGLLELDVQIGTRLLAQAVDGPFGLVEGGVAVHGMSALRASLHSNRWR